MNLCVGMQFVMRHAPGARALKFVRRLPLFKGLGDNNLVSVASRMREKVYQVSVFTALPFISGAVALHMAGGTCLHAHNSMAALCMATLWMAALYSSSRVQSGTAHGNNNSSSVYDSIVLASVMCGNMLHRSKLRQTMLMVQAGLVAVIIIMQLVFGLTSSPDFTARKQQHKTSHSAVSVFL